MAYEPMPRTLAPLDAVTHRAPQDGSYAYTSSSTITASGFPVDLSDTVAKVLWVGVKASAGTSWSWYVEGRGGISFYFSASNVLTCTGATPFASGDTYVVGLIIDKKAHVKSVDALRVNEINKAEENQVGQNLVDVTDKAAETAYYPSTSGESLAGYPGGFSVHQQGSGGVTFTVEASIMGTDWGDVTLAGTNYLTGAAAAASYVDTNCWLVFNNFKAGFVRFKVITSDATNALQIDIFKAAT